MPQNLRRHLDQLLAGTWFIPSIIASGAFLLAFVALKLDGAAGDAAGGGWRWVYASEPREVRALVMSLLTSMITMASLVFSITMVVLTLAARQFGPRLLREFMSSTMTQVILGLYVMTILYCLLILGATGSDSRTGSVAHPSASIGIALVFANAVLLIFFLHSLGRSLMSESIIDRIGKVLDATLDRFEPLDPAVPGEDRSALIPDECEQPAARFGMDSSGYAQSIETGFAVRAAEEAGVMIVLDFRPGDYVVRGGKDVAVYPAQKCSEQLRRRMRQCIALGIDRTPLQDPMFSIRHLVEVALRALSPGVSDPYTATAVLDRLSSSLSRVMGLALPSGVFRDAAGEVRLIFQEPNHATLMGAAFDQIRQNGGDKPLVLIHMIEAIARIAAHTRLPAHVELLQDQLDLIELEMERATGQPQDLGSVKARLMAVRQRAMAQHRLLAAEGLEPGPQR
jgi:uncharacterized membrane protein